MTNIPLWAVVQLKPQDYEPYGKTKRIDTWDCSNGCRYFKRLLDSPDDYGVCVNLASHRCGLLTFEHQGCTKWQEREREWLD